MRTSWTTPSIRMGAVIALAGVASLFAIAGALKAPRFGFSFEPGQGVMAHGEELAIEALDLTPEPGEISDDAALARFFDRQARLSRLLGEGAGEVSLRVGEEARAIQRQAPSIGDLHPMFWIQWMVGIGALLISGWIWALRPADLGVKFFALSGVSTLCFTFSSAIYTTRELALAAGAFRPLVALNSLGASAFGLSMIALFAVYPVRLKAWRWIVGAAGLGFGGWTILSVSGFLPAWAGGNLITLLEMVVICLMAGWQFVATKRNPVARASLVWFGLSVVIGAGGFISLNALPLAFGFEAALAQGYAFLFFLLIYMGLAAGLTRYKLFEVGSWAFRFLFYSVGAALLVMMDAALVFWAGLDRLPALGISFFAAGIAYLPLRDWAQGWFLKREARKPQQMIQDALKVALGISPQDRAERWRAFLEETFRPLEMLVLETAPRAPAISSDGASLSLPSVAGAAPCRLSYPRAGTGLFSRDSVELASGIIGLIRQAEAGREAYDRGVAEERRRIAQDLHEDVGARLLTGLHSTDHDLRPTIQGAIADIRSIVSGISGERVPFENFLSDLRYETRRRFEGAGVEVSWPVLEAAPSGLELDYRFYKTVGSCVREVVSNVIRHSGAKTFSALIDLGDGKVKFSFRDSGRGFSAEAMAGQATGFGLKNLSRRVAELGGELQLRNADPGAEVILLVPLAFEKR